MKILIAPLNWGLGHATRCVPLILQYVQQGHEVVLAGDGDSLIYLYRYFPSLRMMELASLNIQYSKGSSQVWAMCKMLPRLLRFAVQDHAKLKQIVQAEHFDLIISDNRFGLYNAAVRSVYITHQLHIALPHRLQWLEPVAQWLHRCIYKHYDEVWVPDYAESSASLSGKLSHPSTSSSVRYINPLSRFQGIVLTEERPTLFTKGAFTLCLLSGPEPQRSLLESHLMDTLTGNVLIVRGLIHRPPTTSTLHPRPNTSIILVPYLDDRSLAHHILGAQTIICRSGYSTIMDLAALKALDKALFIPTPGQPEQEYLADYFLSRTKTE